MDDWITYLEAEPKSEPFLSIAAAWKADKARLAEAEAERALIVARAENAEAALAYAVSTGDECAIEVEALRKDAERYRWLRDSAGNDIMEKLMAECSPPRWDELVDAAIDAAMGERP